MHGVLISRTPPGNAWHEPRAALWTTGPGRQKMAWRDRGTTMGRPGTPSLLREINDRAALELLLAEGPLTRSQVGEGTGLSKVTAS